MANKRFIGKKVIITGGTSGIGKAAAFAFAAEGAAVTFCGRRERLGREVQAKIEAAGGKALFVAADVRKPADMDRLVEAATSRFGGLDIAFNNAGINHLPHRAGEIPPRVFHDVMATNFEGVFYAMESELNVMAGQKKGCIINMASILSEKVSGWMSAYSASKGAVVSLSKSAAEDYRDFGIRIYAVSPGAVDTPMYHKALKEIAGDPDKYAGGLPKRGKPLAPEAVAKAVMEMAVENSPFESGVNRILPV